MRLAAEQVFGVFASGWNRNVRKVSNICQPRRHRYGAANAPDHDRASQYAVVWKPIISFAHHIQMISGNVGLLKWLVKVESLLGSAVLSFQGGISLCCVSWCITGLTCACSMHPDWSPDT